MQYSEPYLGSFHPSLEIIEMNKKKWERFLNFPDFIHQYGSLRWLQIFAQAKSVIITTRQSQRLSKKSHK